MSDFCSVLGSGYLASACRSLFYSGKSESTSRCGWLYDKALDESNDAGTDGKTDAPKDKGPDKPDLSKDFRWDLPIDFGIDGPKDVGGEGKDVTPIDVGTDIKTDTAPTWTYCYYGNVYPETDGWAETKPSSTVPYWPTKNISGGILELKTEDLNTSGYYTRAISSLIDSTGWIVEGRMKLVNSQGSTACQIQVQDDKHNIVLSIDNNRIVEINTNKIYVMDPRVNYFTYKISKKNGAFQVFVDGISQLSGTAAINSGTGSIVFHDPAGTYDSHAFWDYVCYYDKGI